MTSAADLSGMVLPAAADDAVTFARMLRLATGQSSYFTQAGHLSFAYMTKEDGSLVMLVNWHQQHKLLVEQASAAKAPSRVVSFDQIGPWVQELTREVQSMQAVLHARQVVPRVEVTCPA
jgi:hypothetical protein